MTNNQHGQVPEALIDLIDTYAETRHRCGGIYNAKTEAARKAVIEALSGVQALSAAPAVPNGDELRKIARAARTSASDDASPTEYVLAGWKAAMLTASPTPPAEQQATKETSGGFHVWRDISTAPKDGSRFVAIGYNYGLYSEGRHICVAQWFRGCWMETSDWNEASELKHLTHWLPLPSPPDNAAELNDLDVSVSPQQAAPKAVPGEPVHGDVLPPVGSRVYIRHGRDNGAHACTVTGYYAWGDLGGDKRLHRVFVRLVYEGTDTQQARMLCDCHPTAEAALSEAAPQQEAQEPVAFPTMLRKMWSGLEVQQWINENWPRNTAPQPAPVVGRMSPSKEWLETRLAIADDSDVQAGVPSKNARPCDAPPGCDSHNCHGCDDFKHPSPTPQPAPAPLSDDVVKDAARWRWLSEHIGAAWNEGKFTSLVRIVSDKNRAALNASIDRMMAGDWSDAALSAQGGKKCCKAKGERRHTMSNTPTDPELKKLAEECGIGWAAGLGGMDDFLRAFASAVLAKWGTPQPAPDCHHRPPCAECAALARLGEKT